MNPDMEGTCFFFDGDLLCRKWKNPNMPPDIADCVIQIFVPKCLQSKLLEIAHFIQAAGHLGITKTFHYLTNSFYFPPVRKLFEIGVQLVICARELEKVTSHMVLL